MSWTPSERLMYVQFTTCAQEICRYWKILFAKVPFLSLRVQIIYQCWQHSTANFYHLDSLNTAENTIISPHFQVWEFCVNAQFPKPFGNCAFIQNFHIRQLGKILVFYVANGNLFWMLSWRKKKRKRRSGCHNYYLHSGTLKYFEIHHDWVIYLIKMNMIYLIFVRIFRTFLMLHFTFLIRFDDLKESGYN